MTFVNFRRLGGDRHSNCPEAGAVTVNDFETGEPLAKVAQAVGGDVTMDLRHYRRNPAPNSFQGKDWKFAARVLSRAAELFCNETIEVAGENQSPDEFIRLQSRATGTPEAICRRGMQKCQRALERATLIVNGLIAHSDPSCSIDRLFEDAQDGPFLLRSKILGLNLPSNATGVNSLWLPLVPFVKGLVIKPGSREIFGPLRLFHALIEAGVNRETLGYYPGDHSMEAAVIGCDASMIFGNWKTVKKHASNPNVETHGPGFSKIFVGDAMLDEVFDQWESTYRNFFVESIDGFNSGKSCLCCSSVWVPPRGAERMAELLAEALQIFSPKPMDDPEARLSAFPSANGAKGHWQTAKRYCDEWGLVHVTERFGSRVVQHERHSFFLPTVMLCRNPQCPATQVELPGHFVTVVACEPSQMPQLAEETLIATVLSPEDGALVKALQESPLIDQVNVGAVPTTQIQLGRPHEGNGIDLVCRIASPKPVSKAEYEPASV